MGVTWIEASAGTGKTYTLVSRVLELLRGGLPADRVLLVTFTEKATAELKTRIREALRDAWKAGHEPLVGTALEEVPSMTISTIHGFCRGLLTRFPLESGVSFRPEQADAKAQWRHLLREELRPHLEELDLERLTWAGWDDEEDLLSDAVALLSRGLGRRAVRHPDAGDLGAFERWREALAHPPEPWQRALNAAASLGLPSDADEYFPEDLRTACFRSNWYRKPYDAVRRLAGAQTALERALLAGGPTLDALSKWDRSSSLWKKGAPARLDPAVERVQEAAALWREGSLTLREGLADGVEPVRLLEGCSRFLLLQTLTERVTARRSNRELTHQDVIDRVRMLVEREGPLAAAARNRWSAVLVDEFQDTDPDQWAIFQGLFAGPNHQLFLVGDPKQSIYRFRGADLDTYRRARTEVVAAGVTPLVLDKNFRATEAMVDAVNRLFTPPAAAWERPDDFLPSTKGPKPVPSLVRSGDVLPPLAEVDPSGVTETAWHQHLAAAAVGLLDGSTSLTGESERPLRPSDLLVLVRTGREAWAVHRTFSDCGLPVSQSGSGGLLATREAREVVLFLQALERPRSAAATRAFGWTRFLRGAPVDLWSWSLSAAQSALERGAFLSAFRTVLAAAQPGVVDGGGLENLLSRRDGTRLVTNAEHVLELVQERWHQGKIPPGKAALSLETWIDDHREENEMDLRRDAETASIRIMTIHKAKGLEAPVVLHGFVSEKTRRGPLPWVAPAGLDYLGTTEGRHDEEAAERAEALRLRYVALTRASAHQVLLAEGGVRLVETEAGPLRLPAQSQPREVRLADPLPGLDQRFPRVESHSGLWKRSGPAASTDWDQHRVSRDEEAAAPDNAEPGLPAGPAFGDLIHDILEQADYRGWAPDASARLRQATRELVERLCRSRRSAFRGVDWSQRVFSWLEAALNTELALGDQSVVFSRLEATDTRRELEFHLKLPGTRLRSLDWGPRRLELRPGYFMGRIDLLFRSGGNLYLADWKTNRLHPGTLPGDVMAEAGYDVQAQWYWEALTRLCRLQNEPLEPGGVLYVFLRGAQDAPAGVFLPPAHLKARTALAAAFQEDSHG